MIDAAKLVECLKSDNALIRQSALVRAKNLSQSDKNELLEFVKPLGGIDYLSKLIMPDRPAPATIVKKTIPHIIQNWANSKVPLHLDAEQLYPSNPTFGVVIGTYAAVPYVHLQLEARKRLYPRVPLLVHDDASPASDQIEALCKKYGCDFETNSERQPHHLGDLTAFVGGLLWASEKKLDVLVKISRRWLFLVDWVTDLRELLSESQYATASNFTTTFNFGFRTEAIALSVKKWSDTGFIRTTINKINQKQHVFVESYIHMQAMEFEKQNCFRATKWKSKRPMPYEKSGYAQWPLIGTDRGKSDPKGRFIWHDCDSPKKYLEVSQSWGLKYTEQDFIDPNMGFGLGKSSQEQKEVNPYAQPSAWIGLESLYQSFLANIGPINSIVEIGVDYGWSLFHFATHFPNAQVVGIDPYEVNPKAWDWVQKHIAAFPNARVIKEKAEEHVTKFSGSIDLLHIDGDHKFESVKRDFELWSKFVRPGGCVLFHDVVSIADVARFFGSLKGRKEMVYGHHGLGCWYNDPTS